MRRVMLLALLVLALPTVALAGSVTFETFKSGGLAVGTYTSGDFLSGTISGSITNGGSVDISVVGNDSNTPFFSYDVVGLTNTHCTPPIECFDFKTATVTIDNAAHLTVFTGSIINGGLNVGVGENNASVFGDLGPNSQDTGGLTGINFEFMGGEQNPKLTGGQGYLLITPEPSALEGLLLGTGFIGLVSMVGRKLKLGGTSARPNPHGHF